MYMILKLFLYFRPYREGGKRSIITVNTVPLVYQHTEYIRRHTDLHCKGYSGEMKVDFWSEEQWLAEIEEHKVLLCSINLL